MKRTLFLTLILVLLAKPVFSQEYFIGEIKIFAEGFEPKGWAQCNGQLMAIRSNTALFSLLGIQFGGDGVNTFALPDLRGRVPIGQGTSVSNTNYAVGDKGGSQSVVLQTGNIPEHSHTSQIQVNSQNATLAAPTATSSLATAGSLSGRALRQNLNYNTATPDVTLQSITTSSVGNAGSSPISIVKPSMPLVYCIALTGSWPPRQ
ncbi:tail fiber protein [Flavobacterium sp.]|uniref:phage tail protein n=1 Tax=Flavobacterium sp. TaxID=239 RepID=UPI0032648EF1